MNRSLRTLAHSDAQLLANVTIVPALVWAFAWTALSLVILVTGAWLAVTARLDATKLSGASLAAELTHYAPSVAILRARCPCNPSIRIERWLAARLQTEGAEPRNKLYPLSSAKPRSGFRSTPAAAPTHCPFFLIAPVRFSPKG